MVFKSRAALERYIKALLIEVPAGAELTGEAEEIVTDLINHHPKAAEKTGAGIKKIVVRPDQIWKKNKQFWIVRQDGTEIDFSYRKCLHGEMSRIDLFRAACRTAVALDIQYFKIDALKDNPVCPHLGITLDRDNSHVDHAKPLTFNRLVDEFIQNRALVPQDVKVIGEVRKEFADREVSVAFRNFHKAVAHLELVSAQANQTVCK
jgi:hypothetical protein